MIKMHLNSIVSQRPPLTILTILIGLSALACKSESPPEPQSTVQPTTSPAAEPKKLDSSAIAKAHGTATRAPQVASAEAPEIGIAWDTPPEWKKEARRRMMRVATYQIPGKTGDAELAVFYFGQGQGGGVEENMARWISQFKDLPAKATKRAQITKNGIKRYVVSVEAGTFASGMPGGPQGAQEKWGLEGAIVESPSGSYYFKMTGPSETIRNHATAFTTMLDSIQIRKTSAQSSKPSAQKPVTGTNKAHGSPPVQAHGSPPVQAHGSPH